MNRTAAAAPELHLCLHRRRSGTVLSVNQAHLEAHRAQNRCGYEQNTQESLQMYSMTKTPVQVQSVVLKLPTRGTKWD